VWGFVGVLLTNRLRDSPNGGAHIINYTFGAFIFLYVPKLVYIVFLLSEDAYRVVVAAIRYIGTPGNSASTATEVATASLAVQEHATWISRSQFLSRVGLLVAAVPMALIGDGIIRGRYNYRVHHITLRSRHLPPAFNGFRIAQLSDVHSGSFDSVDDVKRGLKMLQDEAPDLILFTGDMVNNVAHEFEPWAPYFARLEAPYGKFAVLGNHDYGDYVPWPSRQAKADNLERLLSLERQAGFDVLRNEARWVEKDGQRLAIVGVENWGLPPFPQHGDLDCAASDIPDDAFKILLSHDPSHWDAKTLRHPKRFDLTLAGHTHGMQFGVELGNVRWSPVKYKYPRWADLHSVGDEHLYVNRGFGFLGFPGRVGILPEITVITLERA
jgi:predicted MPP superfamily phosphohydrolase